ncbi:ComF family protein [Gluconacetobacter takamatsuzukensis]|uniref:ComF family protein n=2 Tax=Gluconacetobacter takamatsuzukensis TaxID=1286190 RepID=A0A7W4KCE3_9PROT|nr:ComF family protein [Gluconacetobacter takamatsuzukensis]
MLDLLLPPDCPACHQPVDRAGLLCPDCFRGMSFIADPCCARCGQPFAAAIPGGAGRVCAPCLDTPPPWQSGRAALVYDERSRALVLRLKYADRIDLAPLLAGHMARAGRALLAQADLLVPVPLHRARLFRRRYNQAGLLAAAIGRIAHLPVLPDALVRVRRTQALARLGAGARHDVLQGAIVARASRRDDLAGRRIVLVDDVMTTGATLGACARAVMAAGAASVNVLVAARAPDPARSNRDGWRPPVG